MRKAIPLPTKNHSARGKAAAEGKLHYSGRACPICSESLRFVTDQQCVACVTAERTYYSRAKPYEPRVLAPPKMKADRLEKARARHARQRKEHPERHLYWGAKARAKAAGRAFNIEMSDVVIPKICPVFGTPMISPSIDRTDSSKGYVKGNVEIISFRANTLKSNGTLDEFRALVAYLERKERETTD